MKAIIDGKRYDTETAGGEAMTFNGLRGAEDPGIRPDRLAVSNAIEGREPARRTSIIQASFWIMLCVVLTLSILYAR